MPLSNYGVPLADIYKNVEAIKSARNANRLDQYKMQDIERVNQERETLAGLYRDNPNNTDRIPGLAAKAGLGPQVPALTTAIGGARESTNKADVSDMEKIAQLANGIDSADPNAMPLFKQLLQKYNVSPDVIAQMPDTAPPEQVDKLKEQLRQRGLSSKESFYAETAKTKASGNYSDYKDIKVSDDGRLIGRKKGTGVYEYLEMPGEARVSPSPIMYDTGQGVTPLSRKTAIDIANTGGKLEKLQQPPAGVTQDYANNNVGIKKVELVLDAMNPKPTKETLQRLKENKVQWDKDAFGKKTFTPGLILNRIDSKGTDVRALVGDLGSMKIHERSGAAVTASEFPRLRPFIPLDGDDSPTVRKKITGFLREYKLIQQEINDLYSKDRGFVPLDKQVKNNGNNNPDSWEDEQYLYRRLPDGTTQRKAK